MPGRSPYEAFVAFVDPLASAIGSIARAKFRCSSGGKTGVQATDDEPDHRLFLGTDDYVPLHGKDRFGLLVRMRYRIITDDREGYGSYRVTTRGYAYSLQDSSGRGMLDYHWHPTGRSDETRPHLHVGSHQLTDDAVLTNKLHIPTGRVTLEDAVRAAIGLGAEPLVDDWDDRLTLSESPHKLYRSWH